MISSVGQEVPSLQFRFNNALGIYSSKLKTNELANILRESSLKELQTFFPVLVENIFGLRGATSNTVGWNLLSIVRLNQEDFTSYFSFLHPKGFLFEVIYKLLTDVYLKYEFPLTNLPNSLRQQILEGNIPPFYMDKILSNPHSRLPAALLLNAFEFYLFHFSYYLINPWLQNVRRVAGSSHETVYLYLSDLYLTHFLPIHTSSVQPVIGLHQATPLPRSPPPQNQYTRTPRLLKPSVVLKLGTPSMSPPTVPHPHTAVWRSETLAQIIICMWLSYEDENKLAWSSQRQTEIPGPRTSLDLLPSEDHLRVVRNMIKHVYYFSYNIHNDNSPMDELRNIILTCTQKPTYLFLRRHIHHWPLDSSFILILETYLTFIQPWRYVNYNMAKSTTQEQCGESNHPDQKWFNFIAENILSYTVIIGELIPRFARLDLTSPRHAQMLFRLSKVLGQTNFATILKEIENCLDLNTLNESNYMNSSYGTPNNSFRSSSVSLSLSHKLNALVRQQILELESSKFQYTPLFGPEFRVIIVDFIKSIQQAHTLVTGLLQATLTEQAHRNTSILVMIKDFFENSSNNYEYSVDDRQKTVTYLECAKTLLCEVFEVTQPEPPDPNVFFNNNTFDGDTTSSSTQSTNNTTVQPSLLDPKDWMKRSRRIKFDGNPDLQPIRSDEVACFVRFLHRVSCRINEEYSRDISMIWHRNDLWGRIARQFLATPTQVFYFDKQSGHHSSRVAVDLPPRVCLRPLASYKLYKYFIFLGVLAAACRLPLLPVYFGLFVFYIMLVLLKALIEPFLTRSSPQRTVSVPLDGSFNE